MEDTSNDVEMSDCANDSDPDNDNDAVMEEIVKNDQKESTTFESKSAPNNVMDIEKLFGLLKEIKSAGDLIAAKDIMLLIGLTGAGKTTSTLYLAGTSFEEEDVDGFSHFKPTNVRPDLAEFAVSGGASSVTKSIHATTVELPVEDGSGSGGESFSICDTPGFGDTKGAEMEISNGLGIIHSLQRAASVKPVVVLDYLAMSTVRWSPLRKTLSTVIAMMGRESIDFSSFAYLFTRCEGRASNRIHKQLAALQKTLRSNPADILGKDVSDKDILDAFLTDMISKTEPNDVICIDPMEPDEATDTLRRLWSGGRLENPKESFVNFCSQDALNELQIQVNVTLDHLDKCFEAKDLVTAEATLRQMICLAEALALQTVKEAKERGQEKAKRFVEMHTSDIETLVQQVGAPNLSLLSFQEAIRTLPPKLKLLAQTERIHAVCRMAFDYDTIEKATVQKLFSVAQDQILEVGNSCEVIQSKDLLQKALHFLLSVVEGFEGIVASEKIKAECSTLLGRISSLIESVLSPVEAALENLTGAALNASLRTLLFVLDMQNFVKMPEISRLNVEKDQWSWLEVKLGSITDNLFHKSKECAEKLVETIHGLNELVEKKEEWTYSSPVTLRECADLQEKRGFLLALSSSDSLLAAVDNDLTYDPGPTVAHFDVGVSSYMTAISVFAQHKTKAVLEKKVQKEEDIGAFESEAKELLALAVAACSSCATLRESDAEVLIQVEKELVEAQGALKRYIEEPKRMPGHGIRRPRRLEPSPRELAAATTSQAKAGLKNWYRKAVELRAFKIKNGHCNVPQKHPKLGEWVQSQRKEKKKYEQGLKTAMTDEKLEHLASMDFCWNHDMQAWNTRFAELQKFKETHGHCRVPRKTPKLGDWAKKQRCMYKAKINGKKYGTGKVDKGRISQLKALGMFDDIRA